MSSFPSENDRWPKLAAVFEVWGDYGHFRRYYTTRSPLSFPVPPRPTLAGLIGSILGVPKGEPYKLFSESRARLAVSLRTPTKMARMGINWVGTKGIVLSSGLIDERTQINLEFLKDPHFRIYALLRDDDTRQQLGHLLQNHMSVYTPCLGVSELLADFKWIGWQEAELLGEGTYEISSALPAEKVIWPSAGQGVSFEQGRRYTRIRVPRILEKSRAVTEWQDLLVETSAKSIKAHVSEGWRVGEDIVVWL